MIMAQNMKKGDKVWVFDNFSHKIGQIELSYLFPDGRMGHLGNDVNTMYVANVHFFPTREALCEHYRKIFE